MKLRDILNFPKLLSINRYITLLYSQKPEFRNRAVRALIDIGEPAIPHLIKVMASDPNQAGSAANNALMALKERAVPALAQLASENPQAPWLWNVLLYGSPQAKPAIIHQLIPLLSHSRLDVRIFAAHIVANHANYYYSPAVEAPMLALLRNPETRYTAAQFFNTKDIRIVEALLDSLRDTNIYIRTRAVQSLVQIREGRIRAIGLLHDANPEIRRLSVQIVGAVGGLRAYTDAQNSSFWNELVETAGQPLLDLMRDHETGVRRRVIKALVNLHHPDAEQALSAALDDRDWTIRRDAAKALERLRGA